jgi:hypothetical protein
MSTGKGKKRIKNQPVLYDELKRQKTVWLTNTTWGIIQENAARRGMSCSEYLEGVIKKFHAPFRVQNRVASPA